MKIITWNASMRFRDKIEEILPFEADILVIPECEAPEKWKNSSHLQFINQFLWFGDNVNKGIGVISLNINYQIEIHPSYNREFRYIIPLIVDTGYEKCTLFAIWTQKTKKQFDSYIGQIYLALTYYKSLLQEPCILAGDWNSNKIFDYIKRVGTHSEVVEYLKSVGITSAYHKYFNEVQGKESKPTHYFRKNKERPFHIDYVFASESVLKRLSIFEIGTFEKWIMFSDHAPIYTVFNKW